MAENINWDEAIGSGDFVRLSAEEEKKLTLTNHRLEKVNKFGSEAIEFQADVVVEDGETVKKLFTTISNRLKKKLRPIFENKAETDKTHITILMVGEKFDTQYSVKEV